MRPMTIWRHAMQKNPTHFNLEIESGYKFVAGIDEAGRGPLCGPVVAAAVMISSELWHDKSWGKIITDSKKMTERARESAFEFLYNEMDCGRVYIAVSESAPSEIDELNILWASMAAMDRARNALPQAPEFCLVDGNRLPRDLFGSAVVSGDAISKSIAAASIVAKVTRDRLMAKLSEQYPEYNWVKNKGYPTADHLSAIKKYGVNEHYRKSFGPVRDILDIKPTPDKFKS